MMKKIGIYKIINPSGKVYIGQSTDLEFRIKRYKTVLPIKQTKLYNSILKHGIENHTFEIIEECSIELLNERERYWQDYYNCLDGGLNCRLTETGDFSGLLSEEVKLKLSLAKLGKPMSKDVRQKISNSRKGMKFSEEVRKNMSNSQKGRKHSLETLKKLSDAKKGKIGNDANNIRPIIDLLTGIEYCSIQEASKILDISYHKIYYHVKKGIKFKYKK